ncbi:MAG TPA: GspH/FimT family pseudopilin [Gemmatimonadales bacterium]
MREDLRQPRVRAPRPDRKGFTLVELVMVVALIGIVAAMAIPRMNTSAMHADAAARNIRGAIQVAQRTAVMRQYDVIVSIDADAGALRVVEDRNDNSAVDVGERTTWIRLDNGVAFATPPAPVGLATGPKGAVMLSQPRNIDGLPSVIFRRNGAASSDAELFIRGPRGRDADFRAVTITRATGRADWFRRGDHWRAAS